MPWGLGLLFTHPKLFPPISFSNQKNLLPGFALLKTTVSLCLHVCFPPSIPNQTQAAQAYA